MKILITGAFGQLGMALSKTLSDKYELIRTGKNIPTNQTGLELNIQNKFHLREIISLMNPDLIINLAAMTDVDACESNPYLAKEINIGGIINLCEIYKGKIIQISTDYVFDGKDGPYKENDDVCPISVYGETKLAAERILLDNDQNNLIIRGNVLYDYTPFTNASFLNWVILSLKNNKEIKVVNDQINNPTWTTSMADIINLCILKELKGIYHWGDADFLSRFDFAVKIAKKYSLKLDLIHPISTQELMQNARRPLKSGLISDKIVRDLNVVPPTIDECLNMILNK